MVLQGILFNKRTSPLGRLEDGFTGHPLRQEDIRSTVQSMHLISAQYCLGHFEYFVNLAINRLREFVLNDAFVFCLLASKNYGGKWYRLNRL